VSANVLPLAIGSVKIQPHLSSAQLRGVGPLQKQISAFGCAAGGVLSGDFQSGWKEKFSFRPHLSSAQLSSAQLSSAQRCRSFTEADH
jgi:hypothetical protein